MPRRGAAGDLRRLVFSVSQNPLYLSSPLFHKSFPALKRLLSVAVAALLPILAFAQPTNRPHHEVGLMAGVSNYFGDLQDEYDPSFGYHPVGGVLYKYFTHPRIGFRFGAAYTRLSAADSLSRIPVKRARNLNFATNLFEVHGGLEVNLLAVDFDRAKVSPYIFGGIALFYYNPWTRDSMGERVYLRPLSTEGQGLSQYPDRKEYNLVNVAFPIGGGLKFFVGNTLMITTELGLRYCATDYLDDVSRSYVNLDTLGAFRGAQAVQYSFREDERAGWEGNYPNFGNQRGDSKANDWYWFGGISVSIYFDAFGNVSRYLQTRCPNPFSSRGRSN